MLSDEEIELHPVARIYYTRYQTRTYKRASVTDGPGEPLCFLSLAKEVVRRKVAAACAERDARIAKKQARIDQLIQEVAAGADVEAEQRARIAELEQQLQAYEKHGVTCQTFRHFVSEPCAECNSPGRCAIKEQT